MSDQFHRMARERIEKARKERIVWQAKVNLDHPSEKEDFKVKIPGTVRLRSRSATGSGYWTQREQSDFALVWFLRLSWVSRASFASSGGCGLPVCHGIPP